MKCFRNVTPGLVCIALLVPILLTACGRADGPTVEAPPPTAPPPTPSPPAPSVPAIDGCSAPDPGYLANPDAAQHAVVSHSIAVEFDLGAALVRYVDTVAIDVARPTDEVLLAVDPTVRFTGLGLWTGVVEGEPPRPLRCERADTPSYHYVRLVFAEPLEPGTALVRLVAEVPVDGVVETLTGGVAVVSGGALGVDGGGAALVGGWLPRAFAADARPAFTIDAVAPDGFSVVASGRPDAARSVWTVPALGPRVTPLVAWFPDGASERGLVVATTAELPVTAADDFAAIDAALATALGRQVLGEQTLVVGAAEGWGLLASVAGLTLVDASTLAAADGMSHVFDAVARQVLGQARRVDGRLVDGLIGYLALGIAEPSARATARSTYVDALAALPRRPAEGEGDVAIRDLTLLDPLYIPIVFGKLPLALLTVEETMGSEGFLGALSGLIATSGPTESIDFAAFERALVAADPSIAATLDALFGATGLVRVRAACADDRVTLRQREAEAVTPLAVEVDVAGARVWVRFAAGETTASAEVEACGEIAIVGQLIDLEEK